LKRNQTLYLVLLSLFAAIEVIFCFTFLGSITIVPLAIVMTLAHIPAIVAALTLGRKAAAIIGAVMGVSSLIIWTFMPPNVFVAFAFSPLASNGNFFSALIAVVPRIIFPIVAAWLYIVLKHKMNHILAAAISAAVGTFVHSFLVLSAIYLVFNSNSVVNSLLGGNYVKFIVAWGGLNAILEIVAAAIVAAAVIIPLEKVKSQMSFSR
jgi:uncharacterized membrane protein